MKARYVLWPVVLFGALSITGACSDGGSSGSNGGDAGDAAAGGSDGPGTSGKGTGATSSGGGADNSGGTGEDGGMSTVGGADVGVGGSEGGAAPDLCVGLDLNCKDDDNPCTEDECNPATGACGIPRTGTSCDDGMFCNGDDTCDAGECTEHAGDPCNGQTCNETDDVCECTMDEHCMPDMPGEWGECVYGSICVETGSRSRPVTTFSCESGACVQDSTVEMENCTRDTDTMPCTDDGLRCTGTETCKAGNCTGSGHSCTGLTPFCYNSGVECRECSGAQGCGSGEKCCQGNCIPTANTCLINPTIINPVTATIILPT